MPVYEYKALDPKGKTISGIMDADSAFSARQKLRGSKIFPVSIQEVQDASGKKEPGTPSVSRLFTLIKPSEVAMMTRQLATLVGAGFPLVTAIDTLIPQTKSHVFKKILAGIKDSIVEGKSFAEALSMYPGTYSPLYINMVHAGETSGTLEIILERLAEIAEKQQDLNDRIKTALTYPILMFIVGAIVLFFLMAYIVPSITQIFIEMNQVLPAPTRFLIGISNLFQSFWWIILIAIATVVVMYRAVKKTRRGTYLLDKAKLSLPAIGFLVKKLAVARFSRTLGSLLENGISMLTSLEIAKNIVGNVIISNTVEDAAQEVERGKGLGHSLSASEAFPSLSVQMIQVGEQSGELEPMLNKVADVFEKEVESSVMRLTSLLEPVMILIMGMLVGFIVISICLPIFEMNQLIR